MILVAIVRMGVNWRHSKEELSSQACALLEDALSVQEKCIVTRSASSGSSQVVHKDVYDCAQGIVLPKPRITRHTKFAGWPRGECFENHSTKSELWLSHCYRDSLRCLLHDACLAFCHILPWQWPDLCIHQQTCVFEL